MEINTTADSDSPSQEIQNESTPANPAQETAPTESLETPPAPEAAAEAVPEPQVEALVTAEPAEQPESKETPSETEATPAPSATEEAPQAQTAVEEEGDPLLALAKRSQAQRLSAPDEERTATLLKEALLEGRPGVARAIEALNLVPWVVGVNAVTAAWPEIKPTSKTQLFAGLAKLESDNAKRMRLSLARGLFKQDATFALKIATNVAKEMREKETGAVSGKNAQIFTNVLIGRAKPWIGQVQLADLKPADADALVHCALLSAFSLPHAPITQLGVLKWAAEGGKTAKLHALVLEAATKSIGRWSSKWQGALRKEVQNLPEELLATLKEPSAEPQQEGEPREKKGRDRGGKNQPARATGTDADAESAEAAPRPPQEGEEPDAETAAAAVPPVSGEGAAEAPQVKQRPVYESKTVPRKPQAAPAPQQPAQQQPTQQQPKEGQRLREAPIPELLRAVESQFQSLRSELQKAEAKVRQKEDELRRAQKKQVVERPSVPIIEGEPTPDELARLNRQLENRNQELQARIEELTTDAEARAVSVGAVNDQPVEDPNAQLRTLLVLKLQEDYEDFVALEKESPDLVVQQHYRTVLRHVFEVLTTEGVQFQAQRR